MNRMDPITGFTVNTGSVFMDGLEKLIKHWHTCNRLHEIRKIIVAFCTDNGIPVPQIRFPLWLAQNAYMTDNGKLAISRHFLFTSASERCLKVLLHELSHLWLSTQENYSHLLALECAFIKTFGKDLNPVSTYPVEYYATLTECALLQHISACMEDEPAGKLRKQLAEEIYKLSLVKQTIELSIRSID